MEGWVNWIIPVRGIMMNKQGRGRERRGLGKERIGMGFWILGVCVG